MENIEKLKNDAKKAIAGAANLRELEERETWYLGRKGKFAAIFPEIGTIPAGERKKFGAEWNAAKEEVSAALTARKAELREKEFEALAESEWIDVTAPGSSIPVGHLHFTTSAMREITRIFRRIGFTRVRYPEVEWDWYAFESLNMPKDHPARDEWETFFIDAQPHDEYGKMVLTPHTSSGQIREMRKGRLPIRMINIAKCYRRQSDVAHLPMFHQFEGLLIDKDVAVTHLKGVLDYFAREFFGTGRKIRLRPFHFRFTEPSFEVDVSCGICGGSGRAGAIKCRLCKSGWLELGGAGMVHPNVLRAGGIDPLKWNGFAFGWGVERTAMMKSGLQIDDIRILYKNDLRTLEQF